METENWMTNLPQCLQNIPIINLAIPGSHNTMTYDIDRHSDIGPDAEKLVRRFGKWIRIFVSYWARAQKRDITTQLKLGVRYFDLRVAFYNDKYYYTHGLLAMEWKNPLIELIKYLESHPLEVVILDFQHFYDMTTLQHIEFQSNLLDLFEKRLYLPKDGLLQDFTIQKSKDINKQILLIYRKCPKEFSNPFWSETNWATPWPDVTSTKKLEKYLEFNLYSRRPGQGFVSQCIITPSGRYIAFRFCSSLRSTAKRVKNRLRPWIEAQTPGIFNENTRPKINVILFDHIDLSKGEVAKWVIQLNHKLDS
uniref:Phosphatidylinositol-specific phospholipase C X domain-containing protein n=1 Tax=Glossina brevipalpis TaxID=37001 RepID=A0A1A9WEX1_9MUSC